MKRFLAALQVGLVAFALATTMSVQARDLSAAVPLPALSEGAASEVSNPETAMTGAYLLRDTLVPRADDLALIQRKPTLYLSSFNDDMATVAYSLEGGRIVYRVVSGTVAGAARDAIDRALARMQRRVAL
ncbi:hypothetical protein [Novosphingobium clariflavum]|uniref:Uncharacterized protein n=1 Tax=Novosphingobium clariflavum TaxID=2029884 RepID=A0ABV6SCV0_9SPHN|nr:hypothetical protein [Novosphingobium clariflavum]